MAQLIPDRWLTPHRNGGSAAPEYSIVEKKAKAGKPCDIIHIVKLDDSRESAFLIQDMFPITEEYIEREYTIGGNHLMLTSEHTANEIEQKARKVMGMLKRGVKFTPTQPDVMAILKKLKERIAGRHTDDSL